jgi:hypothetical protein
MLYHYYYDCYGDLTALLDWFVDRSSFVIGWRVFAPGVSTSRQLVSLFAPTSSSYTHTFNNTHTQHIILSCVYRAGQKSGTNCKIFTKYGRTPLFSLLFVSSLHTHSLTHRRVSWSYTRIHFSESLSCTRSCSGFDHALSGLAARAQISKFGS